MTLETKLKVIEKMSDCAVVIVSADICDRPSHLIPN